MTPFPADFSGATSDEHLIELWLVGRPAQTQKSYRHDAKKLLAFLQSKGKSLPSATIADIGEWVMTLEGGDQYRSRRLISVKSLLRFGNETGYLVFNVGTVIRLPRLKRRTHQRIMSETVAKDMIAETNSRRDHALLRLFWGSACRVSEAVGLNFGDLGDGVVTFFGKGGKTRTVPLAKVILDELLALRRPGDGPETPVFRSKHGKRLTVRSAQRITAAARTEQPKASPHWFRHAHATTAVKNGVLLHELQGQLGHASLSTTSIYVHLVGGAGSAHYIDP